MERRKFIKSSGILASTLVVPFINEKMIPPNKSDQFQDFFTGIQMGAHSFYDEGMEYVLDILKKEAEINVLMFYSHTYYGAESRPLRVMAHDHSVKPRDFQNSNLTRVWVKHHEQYFRNTVLRHHSPDDSFEYNDKDIFKEIRKPAKERDMKIYIRLLEASAGNGLKYIKNYDKVLTKDIEGNPGRGPCWNNPDYREWVYATARDIFDHYEIDGMQYGAERTGPLSSLLFNGMIPTCFCEHCINRNRQKGIDTNRAKEGYLNLYKFIKEEENGTSGRIDSIMSHILRYFQEYSEILAWNYQWFRADEEIQKQLYQNIKEQKPSAVVGRHIDHQRSSWDIFYRSAVNYDEMAEYADFIKPILYHDINGPRVRWWVIEEYQKRMFGDLHRQQTLELFYSWLSYSEDTRIQLDELEKQGMGPEYVYGETKRCADWVGEKAKVIAGIGIDVPWHAPGGMQPYPSDPEKLKESVHAAVRAGADGILASRDYDEMRLSSLRAFGEAIREVKAEMNK